MLKKIEKLIPAALNAIDIHLLNKYPKGIPSGYQSAISGFGTSIMQMGLVPTLAVYYDKDNQADIKRDVLLDTLYEIILYKDSETGEALKSALALAQSKATGAFLRSISESDELKRELKSKLMDAALAFKLTIRTYNLVKS